MTTDHRLQPKIYVASLSDYNAGRLHGRWIDATRGVKGVEAEVVSMLAESCEDPAEEWAIHDYDDFAGLRLGEFETIEHVCELADALAEHGEPFGVWFDNGDAGDTRPLAEQFEEAFCGTFTDLADYARDIALEVGNVTDERLLAWPYNCIDWQRAARELEISGDIWSAPAQCGEVYVFRGW